MCYISPKSELYFHFHPNLGQAIKVECFHWSSLYRHNGGVFKTLVEQLIIFNIDTRW